MLKVGEILLNFVLAFRDFDNVHKGKDVGRILGYVADQPDWSATLFIRESSDVGSFGKVQLGRFPDVHFYMHFARWLVGNARAINVLQLYHFGKVSFLVALLFRIVHPKGKVYLKMDADERNLEHWVKKSANPFRRLIYRITWSVFHLASIETIRLHTEIAKMWRFLERKLLYVPNVVDREPPILPHEIEKVFLFVGRVGAYQKATEVLVQAYLDIQKHTDFDLLLVGPLENGFLGWLDQLVAARGLQDIRGRIKILGNITNRVELTRLYASAAVFVLPSRWESFGLAALEAAYQGCFLIATSTGVSTELVEMTANGELIPIDNVAALAKALLRSTSLSCNVETRKRAAEVVGAAYNEQEHYSRLLRRLQNAL